MVTTRIGEIVVGIDRGNEITVHFLHCSNIKNEKAKIKISFLTLNTWLKKIKI